MQLFPPGKVYDFMRHSRLFGSLSILAMVASVVAFFYPGPKFGTDFVGGTEIEVAFQKPVSPEQVRSAIESADFSRPEVIRVEDPSNPHRWLIRVQEVSIIDEAQQEAVERRLCLNQESAECPPERRATEVKFSPGGEKLLVRFEETPDLDWIRERMGGIEGIRLRPGDNNPNLQNARENRVEVQLMSRGDQLMDALRAGLGAEAVPASPLRSEWIGPKAGAQLRDSAIKSIGLTLVFMMAYIALRFDLRYTPGAVIGLAHDALITLGVLVFLQKELNLTTVASVLFIIGYSINDTVVIFDRVREIFLGTRKGASSKEMLNQAVNQTLSRTLMTTFSVLFVVVSLYLFGGETLKGFSAAIIAGVFVGTYSSIFVGVALAYDMKLKPQDLLEIKKSDPELDALP